MTPFYTTTLKCVGNPDYHQYVGEGVLAPTIAVAESSLEAITARFVEYRDGYALGSGNLLDAIVLKDGEPIGRLSYNGRFWPLEKV